MVVRRLFALCVCLSLGFSTSIALAEDAPAAPAAETEKPAAAATAEQIAELIKQLDHDGFNMRESAQKKLEEAGPQRRSTPSAKRLSVRAKKRPPVRSRC